MRAGSVNTMAGWVRDGTHKLSRWEAILPSMTSASQAGILHGNNDGIPAFRWFERDRQHLMVSSNPADAAPRSSRVSNGEGLLSNNGASICNLITGDATRSYLTTAAIKAEGGGIGDSRAFTSFFFSPSGYLRSFTLFLGEFVKELIQARRTRRSGVQPQMHRGLKYAGMRAASNVVLRDINTSLIIEEMYRGANVIYADFTDYDEIAHHSGPERVEAFEALDGIDARHRHPRQGRRGRAAAVQVRRPVRPRPEPGRDLQAALRSSLGELCASLMGGRATVFQIEDTGRRLDFVNSFLSEVTQSNGVGRPSRGRRSPSRTTDGVVDLDADEVPPPTRRRIDDRGRRLGQPRAGLVHRQRSPPDCRGARGAPPGPGGGAGRPSRRGDAAGPLQGRGAIVIGPSGARYLDEDRVEGEDPTALFGPHTIMSLKREDAMEHAPDLLLISQYDPELGEVAAFEELIGSHGGLGGPQTEPFILHPVEWQLDEEVPLGAPAIYRNIRRWLASIGIELGPRAQPRRVSRGAAVRVIPVHRWRFRRPPPKPPSPADEHDRSVAKIHYEVDGPVTADEFIAALTDFGPRRPELWPNLDTKYYELHEVGDTWADVTEGSDSSVVSGRANGTTGRSRESFAFGSAKRSTSSPARRSSTGCAPAPTAAATWRSTSSASRRRCAVGPSGPSSNSQVPRQFRKDLGVTLDRLSRMPAGPTSMASS